MGWGQILGLVVGSTERDEQRHLNEEQQRRDNARHAEGMERSIGGAFEDFVADIFQHGDIL